LCSETTPAALARRKFRRFMDSLQLDWQYIIGASGES
jgi:hypothetical protein